MALSIKNQPKAGLIRVRILEVDRPYLQTFREQD